MTEIVQLLSKNGDKWGLYAVPDTPIIAEKGLKSVFEEAFDQSFDRDDVDEYLESTYVIRRVYISEEVFVDKE